MYLILVFAHNNEKPNSDPRVGFQKPMCRSESDSHTTPRVDLLDKVVATNTNTRAASAMLLSKNKVIGDVNNSAHEHKTSNPKYVTKGLRSCLGHTMGVQANIGAGTSGKTAGLQNKEAFRKASGTTSESAQSTPPASIVGGISVSASTQVPAKGA